MRIEALANMIDGFIGAIVIRSNGTVLGKFVYPKQSGNVNLQLNEIYDTAEKVPNVAFFENP